MQLSGATYSNMTYNSSGYWLGAYAYNRIWATAQLHPATNDTVLAFKAPISGTVRITGTPKQAASDGGDGVLVKIMKGTTQIWPSSGYTTIAATNTIGVSHDVTVSVSANDMIYFIVNQNSANGHDTTTWDPTVAYQ